jgi:carboxyl-terminal processing protease
LTLTNNCFGVAGVYVIILSMSKLSEVATETGVHTGQRGEVNTRDSLKLNLGLFLAFALATGAFVAGWQLSSSFSSSSQQANLFNFFTEKVVAENGVEETVDLDEFWRVWELLDEKFVTGSSTYSLSPEDKLHGAIDGMVDAYGDPYTVYLPPTEASSFDENISGNFRGVGMEVGMREGLVTVIAPLPDTPAEGAGIIAGDVIVSIDEVSTEDMRLDEAVKMIRGEKGTVVTLEVFREGESDFLSIPITRDTINIPTVETEMIDDTFVLSIYSFNAVAEAQVIEGLEEYLNSGAGTLVLDLRDNPGGYLQSAVNIASFFLPAGKVVVKEQFSDPSQNDVFRSRGRQIKDFTPEELVVLVNNGSASASEILAGALMDHGVATVMGNNTFGKGSVQELVKLDDGSSLKVTVARWLTPNDQSISEGGLTPDIIINRTPAQRLAGEDPQLDAAIRFLKGEEVVSETFADQLTSDAGEVLEEAVEAE